MKLPNIMINIFYKITLFVKYILRCIGRNRTYIAIAVVLQTLDLANLPSIQCAESSGPDPHPFYRTNNLAGYSYPGRFTLYAEERGPDPHSCFINRALVFKTSCHSNEATFSSVCIPRRIRTSTLLLFHFRF